MRENLFKAKRTYNGEWIEGGYLHQTDFYGDPCDKHFIIDGTCTMDYDIGEIYEVYPQTVCQYTGFPDKNRKVVFEHDIVSINGKIYSVVWSESNYEFMFENDKESFGLAYVSSNDVEIIGNVFDNHELLTNPKCGECKCRDCFSKPDCCPKCEGPILGCEEYSENDIYKPDLLEGELT